MWRQGGFSSADVSIQVDCPDGVITGDKKDCGCTTGFNGGGPFDDDTDVYPGCFAKAACKGNTTLTCANLACGYAADGCGGMGSCGVCKYGEVCGADGACSRKGMCIKTVLHQSNGLAVGGWAPNPGTPSLPGSTLAFLSIFYGVWGSFSSHLYSSTYKYRNLLEMLFKLMKLIGIHWVAAAGETYTKIQHWAARPAFKCSDCGWGKVTYMYWNPASDWPAELEIGWYISTVLGSSAPLAYLPERVALPTSQSTAWRFKSGPVSFDHAYLNCYALGPMQCVGHQATIRQSNPWCTVAS